MKSGFLVKLIIILIVVALFAMGVILALKEPTQQTSDQGGQGPTTTISTPRGNVEVKDFTRNPVERVGDVLALEENKDFSIVYFSEGNSFLITLNSQPVQEARNKAETALLDHLGIGKGEACNLNVSLTVPYDVDPNLAGKDYGLSFCVNSAGF